MTPLDDHLRTTLSRQADSLPPSSDPLGGIEARARGLRRRRVAAAVAGAALAVSGIAVAVPALRGGSATPTVQVAASAEALDPAHPWAYRGPALPADVLAGFRAGWSAVHPGSSLTPLFGDLYEPSGRWEAVFVAGDRYGFISGAPGATNLIVDEPLPAAAKALALAVPGDEVPRLLVVAAPDSRAVELDGRRIDTTDRTGVGVAPLEGASPHVKVTGADGTVVYDEPAPTPARTGDPDNLLTWPARGTQDSSLLEPARTALAPSLNADPSQVLLSVLYSGDKDGTRFVVGQAWKRGDARAHSFSYASGGDTFFGPVTPKDPQVLAFLKAGSASDLLVVIPRPGTGQVSYAPTATATLQPVANGRSDLDGIGLIDRSHTATADRIEVLDGDGNIDRPLYRGPVAPLLCGAKECG